MKDYFTNVLMLNSFEIRYFLEYATFFYVFCNQIGI